MLKVFKPQDRDFASSNGDDTIQLTKGGGEMNVSTEVVVAAFSLFGTLAGTFGGIMAGNKLTNYKLDELKKQVEKHNSLIDRMYRIETRVTVIEDTLQAAHAK